MDGLKLKYLVLVSTGAEYWWMWQKLLSHSQSTTWAPDIDFWQSTHLATSYPENIGSGQFLNTLLMVWATIQFVCVSQDFTCLGAVLKNFQVISTQVKYTVLLMNNNILIIKGLYVEEITAILQSQSETGQYKKLFEVHK